MYSVQEDELPEIRFLLIIIGWGELSKAILNETAIHDVNSFRFVDSRVFCQVTWAVFFGRCQNIIRAKMILPSHLRKIVECAYDC